MTASLSPHVRIVVSLSERKKGKRESEQRKISGHAHLFFNFFPPFLSSSPHSFFKQTPTTPYCV
jgi:hypothetical protein